MKHNSKVKAGMTEPKESAADQGEDDKDSGVDEAREERAGTETPKRTRNPRVGQKSDD